MRPRFLAAIASAPAAIERIASRFRRSGFGAPDLEIASQGEHLLILASTGQWLPIGAKAFLIGTAFLRGSSHPLKVLDSSAAEAIEATRGEWLIDRSWGGYVAISGNPGGGADILRAPMGDLPCYTMRTHDAFLCASDLPLLRVAADLSLSLDPAAIARHLAAEDLRRAETCLRDVDEVRGGARLTVSGARIEQQPLWSPWTFAAPDRQLADPEEASRRVRDAACACVAARAGGCGPVILKLSGGLDSSIVAACLSAAPTPFSCLNLVTRDPSGDERSYARAVAHHLNVELEEAYRDPGRIAVELSAAARLPRPAARSFAQESTRIGLETAARTGASAIFDGGGGDNIFCSLQSVRPAADCLMSEARDGRFWSTARSIAEIAQASLWQVGRRAWLASRRRSAAYRWPLDLRFLSAGARRDASTAADHPRLEAPAGALPGKAAHIALIAAAQSVAEGFDVEEEVPTYSPLLSQPLVEACLRVPSWLWFESGLNRAVARRAFAKSLPPLITARRTKGAPDAFIGEVYERNRTLISELLLGGVLMSLGLLDRAVLAEALDDPRPVRGHDFLRIMQLADAEAWARCWS